MVIELQNVTKKFGDKTILKGISLSIPENQIIGIIGPSGSGKTTFLNALMGYLKIEEGSIKYNGKDIKKSKNVLKNEYGFASQSHSFYSKLTVKENISYFGKLYGINTKVIADRMDILLDVVKLKEDKDKLAENLSSGMKKRLDIACSLIHDPKVLILDEPTADLDVTLRCEILNLIRTIKDAGTTVIITSHLLQEVEQLCDKVVLIHGCNAVEIDKETGRKEVSVRFKSGTTSDFVNALYNMQLPFDSTNADGEHIRVLSTLPDSIIQAAINFSASTKDEIMHMNVTDSNLERIFMNRVGK